MQNDKMFMELLREAYDDYLLSFLREEEESEDKTSEPKKKKKRKIKDTKEFKEALKKAKGLEITVDGVKYTIESIKGDTVKLRLPGRKEKYIETTLSALQKTGAEI